MNFDDYAKTWDTDKKIERARIIANEISNSMGVNGKNYSAMEFGCGTGLVSFNLYDKLRSIALVDSSKGMIDILNSKINKYEVTNMVPYHVDIYGNSLSMKFDIIYNSMVLHHILDVNEIIKNFYQLLNKDGYLCIVDLDEEDGSFHKKFPDFDGHNGFNQDHLQDILRSAGFKSIESNTFYYDEIEGEESKYSLFIMTARR